MPHELVLRHPPLKAPPEFTSEPIDVYHPGYDNDVVPLMSFPGYDSKEGDLWHDFAHTACAIISNNRFDGWLSISQDPEAPHVSGELIAPGKYWWHVPQDSPQPYAVIPDFRSWEFPLSIPEKWTSQTSKRNQVESTCQVSREGHASHDAHIVPSSETEWFSKSGLGFRYGLNPRQLGVTMIDAGIDNPNNILLLRADLHHAWDQKKFTFVSKRTKEGPGMFVHCWDEDMAANYHNMPLQGFARCEVLLARLAWTLLPRAISQFLVTAKESRMIWIRDEHGKLSAQKQTAEQCMAIANAPVPRSTSPKKRKQDDGGQQPIVSQKTTARRSYRSFDSGLGTAEEDDDDDNEEGSDQGDDDEDDSQSIADPEELSRGRKRLRASDDWYSYPAPTLPRRQC